MQVVCPPLTFLALGKFCSRVSWVSGAENSAGVLGIARPAEEDYHAPWPSVFSKVVVQFGKRSEIT